MTEAEQIAAFIAARGVTRCPTVAIVETAGVEIAREDVAAREAYEFRKRLQLIAAIARRRNGRR